MVHFMAIRCVSDEINMVEQRTMTTLMLKSTNDSWLGNQIYSNALTDTKYSVV